MGYAFKYPTIHIQKRVYSRSMRTGETLVLVWPQLFTMLLFIFSFPLWNWCRPTVYFFICFFTLPVVQKLLSCDFHYFSGVFVIDGQSSIIMKTCLSCNWYKIENGYWILRYIFLWKVYIFYLTDGFMHRLGWSHVARCDSHFLVNYS